MKTYRITWINDHNEQRTTDIIANNAVRAITIAQRSNIVRSIERIHQLPTDRLAGLVRHIMGR